VVQRYTDVFMEDATFVFRSEKCVGGEICWIMCVGCKECGQVKERCWGRVWANTKMALLGP
jgi:hypothetical protein